MSIYTTKYNKTQQEKAEMPFSINVYRRVLHVAIHNKEIGALEPLPEPNSNRFLFCSIWFWFETEFKYYISWNFDILFVTYQLMKNDNFSNFSDFHFNCFFTSKQ